MSPDLPRTLAALAVYGVIALVPLVVAFILFLLLRRFALWYWRIDTIVESLDVISEQLEALSERLPERASSKKVE